MNASFRSIAEPRGLLVIAGLLGLWCISGIFAKPGPLSGASVGAVLHAARELVATGTLWDDYTASLERVAAGFAIGAALGLLIGGTLGLSVWLERAIGPLLTAMRQVPIFGLVPLLALWFGTGESAKLVLVALGAFYPAALNTHEALRGVPASYREIGRIYRFSQAQMFRIVLLPCAMPGILTGLKHGLSFAWIAVVGAEFFLAAAPGLGNLLEAGREQFRMEFILIGIVLIAGTGSLMNTAVTIIERRLLRWRQSFA